MKKSSPFDESNFDAISIGSTHSANSQNLHFNQMKKIFRKVKDITLITSFIKAFLMENLSQPLLTFNGLNAIVNILNPGKNDDDMSLNFYTKECDQQKIRQILSVLESLPKCHIATLSMLCLHFQEIRANFSHNQLTLEQLNSAVCAQIVGYRCSKPTPMEIKMSKIYQPKIFGILLDVEREFYLRFFTDNYIVGEYLGVDDKFDNSRKIKTKNTGFKSTFLKMK